MEVDSGESEDPQELDGVPEDAEAQLSRMRPCRPTQEKSAVSETVVNR